MHTVSTRQPSRKLQLNHRCPLPWVLSALVAMWACGSTLAQAPPGQRTRSGDPRAGQSIPGAEKKKTPPPKAPPPKVAAPQEAIDSATGLPIGFEPKKDVPELMLLEQQTVSDDTLTKWAKDRTKYGSALRAGELTPAAKALITTGIKWRLGTLTVKANQQNLHEKREDLTVRDLFQAGNQLTKVDQLKSFRQWVNDEVIRETEPLLKNNFYVRVHAATLLGELTIVPQTDPTKGMVFETHIPAVEPLRKVLRDPEQPVPVKIAAARSMIRLIRYGSMPANKRFETAKDVLAELANPDGHYWYQMRLIELLSAIEAPRDLETQKPTVVIELTKILRDPKRHWHVRAEAARALGRVALDPQVNISSLLTDLVQFASEMSKAALADPKAPQWEMTFFKLYLAFQSIDASERDSTKKLKAGLLNNPSAASAAAAPYALILPVVNSILNDQPIAPPQVEALDSWLAKNRPLVNATNANEVKSPTQSSGGPAASSVATEKK